MLRPNSTNAWQRYLARANSQTQALGVELTRAIESGEISVPTPSAVSPVLAGGANHCPDSDFSYSKMAAEVAGTLPATAGDTNQEAWRAFRQQQAAIIGGALKAVGHSTYAANEGVNTAIPDWDRVNGWARIGAAGATQWDVAIQLLGALVGAGQHWYVRVRLGALDAALLPDGVQLYAGFWHKKAAGGEDWIAGSDFLVTHEIHGTPGAQSIDYFVVAKTDSGVSMKSQVLTVPDAPNVLSDSDYVKLFFAGAPGLGFIEFDIYRKTGGLFYHVFSLRDSNDLQYNDTGGGGRVEAFPVVTDTAPRAYAETRDLLVGAYGGNWQPDDLRIVVPPSYDFTQTAANGQYLRIGLTAPTGVDRHVGLDRIWLGTTFNEWAPDQMPRFADNSYPVPSVSPTEGVQGAGGGVIDPPPEGGGGRMCVLKSMPVLTLAGARRRWRTYRQTRLGDVLRGERRAPYLVLAKRGGTVSEFYRIRTRNGVTIECSADHGLFLDAACRARIAARAVRVGTRLAGETRGRDVLTEVVSVKLVPHVAEVGTFTLRDLSGVRRDGRGVYVAGRSKGMDRGLYCSNVKPPGFGEL